MVDQLLGAQHHTVFVCEIAPKSGPGQAAKVHYHPFEEIYYFTSGGMRGTSTATTRSSKQAIWCGRVPTAHMGSSTNMTNRPVGSKFSRRFLHVGWVLLPGRLA
ncbi:hypothetical protein StrepF001_11845 [Streptomyces sp. F001]|nr:hypothetical protein StrepF001_11845 [Streptomyces sp. F001]